MSDVHFKSCTNFCTGAGISQWYSSGLDDRGFVYQQGLGNFLFTSASRPALRPTQPPIQCVPGGRAVKLITHLHLAPRSRMRGAIHPLLQYASMDWCSVKKSTGTTLPLPLSFTNFRAKY